MAFLCKAVQNVVCLPIIQVLRHLQGTQAARPRRGGESTPTWHCQGAWCRSTRLKVPHRLSFPPLLESSHWQCSMLTEWYLQGEETLLAALASNRRQDEAKVRALGEADALSKNPPHIAVLAIFLSIPSCIDIGLVIQHMQPLL